MLNVVGVFYLAFLCFGQPQFPCSMFDEQNCGLFYCVIGDEGCVEDPCFKGYSASPTMSCDSLCRRVTYDFIDENEKPVDGAGSTFCASQVNHFTDCAYTASALIIDDENDIEGSLERMEKYCTQRGCGGLYQVDTIETDEDPSMPFFYCADPGDDGTLGPNDFDVANCKYYEYIVGPNNNCIHDACAEYTGDTCPASCKKQHIETGDGGVDICTNRTDKVTICSSTFGSVHPENDDCVTSGCGPITDVKTRRGNVYYYCSNPEEEKEEEEEDEKVEEKQPECICKGRALILHMPVLVVLSLLIFIFLL